MKIESYFNTGDDLPDFDQDTVKNEPMFFSADTLYAYKHGGPITRAFISKFGLSGIFDSRVHMLMPGWYPCIPGFHHDDVPRERADGQPEYFTPSYRSSHAMALINGDIAPTEFAIGSIELDVPSEGIIYKQWHPKVVDAIRDGKLKSIKAPSSKIIYFSDRSFHQGTMAVASGWRWFGRISWNTDRKFANEIRRQVQVYMPNPMEGW